MRTAVFKAATKGVDEIAKQIEGFVKLADRLPIDSPDFTLATNALQSLREAKLDLEIIRNRNKQLEQKKI